MAAGAMGSFIGNPADLALVRMQADGSLPVDKRRHYTGVGNALARIVSEEVMITTCVFVINARIAHTVLNGRTFRVSSRFGEALCLLW